VSITGKHLEALNEYTKAISLNPGHHVYYSNRAMACIKLFRFEQVRTPDGRMYIMLLRFLQGSRQYLDHCCHDMDGYMARALRSGCGPVAERLITRRTSTAMHVSQRGQFVCPWWHCSVARSSLCSAAC
jgi:hypothetical protein